MTMQKIFFVLFALICTAIYYVVFIIPVDGCRRCSSNPKVYDFGLGLPLLYNYVENSINKSYEKGIFCFIPLIPCPEELKRKHLLPIDLIALAGMFLYFGLIQIENSSRSKA